MATRADLHRAAFVPWWYVPALAWIVEARSLEAVALYVRQQLEWAPCHEVPARRATLVDVDFVENVCGDSVRVAAWALAQLAAS